MDRFFVKILEDGTCSFRADGEIKENHKTADNFLKDAEKMVGGEVKRSSSKGKVDQSEVHVHDHEHEKA